MNGSAEKTAQRIHREAIIVDGHYDRLYDSLEAAGLGGLVRAGR